MTEAAVAARYSGHYLKIRSVYPSVLALKFFLGNNPEFSLRGENFKSKRILDIGFGDGRDLRLFLDLGFEVFGVEVSADVVKHTSEKISGAATLSVGFNNETGYSNDMFDYVYSSAALMYLRDENTNIQDVLTHVRTILKKDGVLIGNFTRSDSHITKGAFFEDKNHIVLEDPFYRIRKGQRYYVHNSKSEVIADLSESGFSVIGCWDYDVNWFGTRETQFLFAARRADFC